MNKKAFAIVVMAGLFTTAGAVAQDKTIANGNTQQRGETFPGKAKERMEQVDTDGDGKISMAEAEKAPKGKLKENFTEIDTNKDNYLDKEEMKAYLQKKRANRKEQKKQ